MIMESCKAKRRQPSMAEMLVWTLLCFIMWCWVIFGSLWLALGVLSFVSDRSDVIAIGAKPMSMTEQKVLCAAMTAVGIAFVWLRRRGYLKFFPEE
jgi:hypothetical protein